MAKRDYQNNYGSVTQILGVLRKIGLENWFKYNTAKFCDEKSSRGKIVGTQIHAAIEGNITGVQTPVETMYPEEVTNTLNSYLLFRKEHPEITFNLVAEMPMTSESYGYNGTMDAEAVRSRIMLPADWKSGECKKTKKGVFNPKPKIYDEMRYQLSAYVQLVNETRNIHVVNAIIVVFAKDTVAYNLYEMGEEELADCFSRGFLPALTIYNLQKEKKTYGKV